MSHDFLKPSDEIINQLFQLYPNGEISKFKDIDLYDGETSLIFVQVKGKRHNHYEGLALAKVERFQACSQEAKNHDSIDQDGAGKCILSLLGDPLGPLENGLGLLLYKLPQNTGRHSRTLRKLIHERYNVVDIAQQITLLLKNIFADWYNAADLINHRREQNIFKSLSEIIIRYVREDLSKFTLYSLGIDKAKKNLFFRLPSGSEILPNPIAYTLRTDLWLSNTKIIVPGGYNHGNLHADNIMCQLSENIQQIAGTPPWVLDLSHFSSDINPFFDLAYLELDLLMSSLSLSSNEDWEDWDYLTKHLTKDIYPSGKPTGDAPLYPWDVVQPIRKYLQHLFHDINEKAKGLGDQFEICWWLSMTVAGVVRLNQYSSETKGQRQAALLYASRALKKINLEKSDHLKDSHYPVDFEEENTAFNRAILSEDIQKSILKPYLNWMIEKHDRLQLPTIPSVGRAPSVPLEKVYVALRGDHTSAFERQKSRQLMQKEVIEIYGDFDDPEEALIHRFKILRDDAYIPTMRERDRSTASKTITLGEAFRSERCLVILGDPGGGKTTLARWLVLKLARALHQSLEHRTEMPRVKVSTNQVDPEAPNNTTLFDLGPARLPVLVRISEYAEWRKECKLGQSSALIEFLGYQGWLGEYLQGKDSQEKLHSLIKDYIDRESVVIILDGMDELPAGSIRDDVLTAIENFIQEHITQPLSYGRHAHYDKPFVSGGNQLIITSRIAGYKAAPIQSKGVSHVIIEPMRRTAVSYFCDSWFRFKAVYEEENSTRLPEEVQEMARVEADGLKNTIFDPEKIGIRELATNPLLITILTLVYRDRDGNLPHLRVELYQAALELLIEIWRDTGMTTDQLVFVLSPIAEHIQENIATGLIEERELASKIKEYLALWSETYVNLGC